MSKLKYIDPGVIYTKLETLKDLDPTTPYDQALFEVVWSLITCEEAIEIFGGEFYVCPVCFCQADKDGVTVHKEKSEILH